MHVEALDQRKEAVRLYLATPCCRKAQRGKEGNDCVAGPHGCEHTEQGMGC